MKYKSCTDYWLNKDNLSFRGEFESMYKDIDDPWGCGEFSDSINNKLFCEVIFHKKQFSDILDIGSGLGELTNELFYYNNGGNVMGWEISKTAVDKARKKYPEITFENKNIMVDIIKNKYDLITVSEVMWYLLDSIDEVFVKLYNSLNEDGILAIHQYFPNHQQFGNNIIDGLEDFEKFIDEKTKFKFINKIVSYVDKDRVLLALLKKDD
jgi:SAM-dependent methyltransferase